MNTIMRYLFIIKFLFFFVLFQEVIVFNNKVIAEQFELKNFKESLKYADAKIWDKSYFYSKKSKSDLAIDLIDWLRLRSGDAVFTDYVNFIDTKSKWPGMPYLSKQAENSITLDEDPQLIINFFENNFNFSRPFFTSFSYNGDNKNTKLVWKNKSVKIDDHLVFVAIKNGIHSELGWAISNCHISNKNQKLPIPIWELSKILNLKNMT